MCSAGPVACRSIRHTECVNDNAADLVGSVPTTAGAIWCSSGIRPPFGDGTKSGTNVIVENLDSGKKIGYALLVPHMVERYGFYEGKGTKYRVDPRKVAEVFGLSKNKKKKKKTNKKKSSSFPSFEVVSKPQIPRLLGGRSSR